MSQQTKVHLYLMNKTFSSHKVRDYFINKENTLQRVHQRSRKAFSNDKDQLFHLTISSRLLTSNCGTYQRVKY